LDDLLEELRVFRSDQVREFCLALLQVPIPFFGSGHLGFEHFDHWRHVGGRVR
jgi:hypothetical protein